MEIPKVQNIGDKILTVANKLATPVAIVQAFLSDPIADGRGIEGSIPFMIERLSNYHVANPLKTTQLALQQGQQKYPIIPGATTAIIGLLMKVAGEGTNIGVLQRAGDIAAKYGLTLTGASIASAWIWLAPFNPTGYVSGQTGTAYVPKPGINVDNPQALRNPSGGSGNYATKMYGGAY